MTERLSSHTFDKLSETIWGLGRVTMEHLFSVAPVPAIIKGELYDGDVCVEPEFYVTQLYPENVLLMPRQIGVTVSDVEVFEHAPDFKLYSQRTLLLDTVRRRRVYSQSVILMDDGGNTMTPQLDVPSLGMHHRPGTQAWRSMRKNESMIAFGEADAEVMLNTLGHIMSSVSDKEELE